MQLATIFQDGMVLQREKPVRIWGYSEEEQTISVWIDEELILETKVSNGEFSITLPPQDTTWNSTICIKAADKTLVTLKDIKIGEVWLAGGQSNMEFSMKLDCEYKAERRVCNNPNLFCYTVPRIYTEAQALGKDIQQQGKWHPSTKGSLCQWTAVGYYFAKKLAEFLPDVPIGIVSCNFGGSNMVSWLPRETIEADPLLAPFWQSYQDHCASLDMAQYQENFAKEQKLGQNPVYKLIIDELYMKGRISESFVSKMWAQRSGKPVENSTFGPWDKWRPAGLHDWMLKKIMGYTVRGAIWYQGEAEVEPDRIDLYTHTMEVLMDYWHGQWQDTFPFLMVELAPFGRDIFQDGSLYPHIRDMQRQLAEKHENVYTVSIMDAGAHNNIHPLRKRPAGERLALTAAANIYGKPVAWQAPRGIAAQWNGKEVVISFSDADGLRADGIISGFELVKGNQAAEVSNAILQDNRVYLPSDCRPDSLRFAWKDYCNVNLYNQYGLAARPFQLDITD